MNDYEIEFKRFQINQRDYIRNTKRKQQKRIYIYLKIKTKIYKRKNQLMLMIIYNIILELIYLYKDKHLKFCKKIIS